MLRALNGTAGALALCASALIFSTPNAIQAAQATANIGALKVNIAGRQRMLTQRMAKSACFIATGGNRDVYIKKTQDAHDEFARNLVGLRSGDAALGLTPTDAGAVLSTLDQVDTAWAEFSPTILGFIDQPGNFEMFEAISQQNLPLLSLANEATGAFASSYSSGDPTSREKTVNMAGRQRMLSQKSAKEFCFIAAYMNPSGNRAALEETVALFDSSMLTLREGDQWNGINAATDADVVAQLDVVDGLWAPVREIYTRVLRGEQPSKEDIEFVEAESDKVLFEMNKAVKMMQEL